MQAKWNYKKGLSLVLAILMLISLLPLAALAAEGQHDTAYIPVEALNTATASTEAELRTAIDTATAPITITITSDFYLASMVVIPAGANVTLTSTAPQTLMVTGNFRHFAVQGILNLQDDITMTRSAARIAADAPGGGVMVYFGTFNIYGGSIYNNYFGGIAIWSPERGQGTITTYGGSGVGGGGVLVYQGRLNMHGGTIANNTTAFSGGGVHVAGENRQVGSIAVQSVFIMRDGVIRDNYSSNIHARGNGGGVRISGGILRMHGGIIENNTAGSNGGGIMSNGGISTRRDVIDMHDGAIIRGNHAGGSGGGLALTSETSTMRMLGGRIENNTADSNGGGIHVTSRFNLHLYRGLIEGNIAQNGGGLSIHAPSIALTPSFRADSPNDFRITNNKARVNGGGIFVHVHLPTGVTIRNVEISGNIAGYGADGNVNDTGTGGGIFFRYGQTLHTRANSIIEESVVFSGNRAYRAGSLSHTFNDFGLAEGLAQYPRIRWSGYATGTTSHPSSSHAINNWDINSTWPEITGNEDHIVTFNLHGGTGNFPPQAVADAGTAIAPVTQPTRTGFTFAGWYTEETDGERFDFSTLITENTTIHAQWSLIEGDTHTITFLPGGTDVSGMPETTREVRDDATIYANGGAVATPSRGGYTFVGWLQVIPTGTINIFSSEELEDIIVTEDMTFEAEWEPFEGSVVSFNLHGGSGNFPSQNVADGAYATEPTTNPTRANHTFAGWYTEATGGVRFDFSNPITANTTIHARWTPIPSGGGGGGGGGSTPTPTPTPTPPDYELHLAYMFGDNRGNFRPSADITRAEVATILARTHLLDFEEGVSTLPPGMTSFTAFSDVQPNNWFFYYVAWAYDAGLIRGDAGRFRPNDPITREEFAAMMARTATVRPAGTIPFPDAYNISNWARAYVYTTYREGFMVGDAQGNFNPQANIARSEVATAMNRVLGRLDSRTAFYAADVVYLSYARSFPDVASTTWYFPSVLAAANDHRLTRDSDGAIDWKAIVR
ncbi:MAG: InlB B-repeat-containing protein [Oscillospiraceae bacterium]|nr:InlB B-repeat-containing protein [Oscillospiraceae bacterium]